MQWSSAAEWLLDNHFVIRRGIRVLREEFPADFERRLELVEGGPFRGMPRIYVLAEDYLAKHDGHVERDALALAVRAFQADSTTPSLSIAELWALPTVLRLGVVERLGAVADRLLAEGQGGDAPDESEDLVRVVASSVRSMRAIEVIDWKGFFEDLSETEQILRRDPSGTYPAMDFATRDSYRKAVEEIARAAGRREPEVARAALARATAAPPGRGRHVGCHLVAEGRDPFASEMGVRAGWRVRTERAVRRHRERWYLGAIAGLTAATLAALAGWVASVSSGTVGLVIAVMATLVLALVPAVTVAVGLVNTLVPRLTRPRVLPKMRFDAGIPESSRTLVAIPALLSSHAEIESLIRALEIRFLANRDPNLGLLLLTDCLDAPSATMPDDDALIGHAARRIRELNAQHGGDGVQPFHLLHRARVWSDSERCWMGWERKRGKLEELNHLLKGGSGAAFVVRVGAPAGLRDVRFVIVLDADTELPRGAARHLVESLSHPLNRAEFTPEGGTVHAGYTVLQPRVEAAPLAAHASWLAATLSGRTGLDPYTRAVSDTYQDLFGEGAFVGKGIYEVESFDASLRGRVPDGTLLSHDLFEGIHGRAALVSDVVLLENPPDHYLVLARRAHRWVRGDWQLLPWLCRRVPLADGSSAPNRLSAVSRWKLLDNLRRSLLSPALLICLMVGWIARPHAAVLWTVLVLVVLATSALADAACRLASLAGAPARMAGLRAIGRDARSALQLWGFEVCILPHQAALHLDAIVRTLFRVMVSRRHLLEWTPAAQMARRIGRMRGARPFWREMLAAPLTALLLAVLLDWSSAQTWIACGPLLLLWAGAPGVAAALSRPRGLRKQVLGEADEQRLRLLARRTWAFFESFVGPDDQWLPPDHVQEDPGPRVARRTSPTNIGFAQVANVCAFDFGYRGLLWVLLRQINTLDTLDRMERHRGHFLNWYDTATLEPLAPRYVSTVDSGNLVACLVVVKQAAVEFAGAPVVREQAWLGLLDSLRALRAAIESVPPGERPVDPGWTMALDECERRAEHWRRDPASWATGLRELRSRGLVDLDKQLVALLDAGGAASAPGALGEIRWWSAQVHRHVGWMLRELTLCAPWIEAMATAPALLAIGGPNRVWLEPWQELAAGLGGIPLLRDAPTLCERTGERLAGLRTLVSATPLETLEREELDAWFDGMVNGLAAAQQTARFMLDAIDQIARRIDRLCVDADFGLLYDAPRRLFSIGYDVAAARFDANHYDLLASEARLTSFLAIAGGQVPEEHWLQLGRPIGSVTGGRVLLSWSGTMFEYLMPSLFLREGDESLVGRSCRVAVTEQMAYATRHGVPWGISESGYFHFDAQGNHQYRAFGIPDLGFKRGLDEDLVVAPYASLLALDIDTAAVVSNLDAFEALGAVGRYGLYEAIDFTEARMPVGRSSAVVRSFMAHHQGMVLAALDNRLHAGALVRRFHAAPLTQTAETLLCERVEMDAPLERTRADDPREAPPPRRHPPLMPWEAWVDVPFPQVHALSNGSYGLVISESGSGYARWRGLGLTRWGSDPTLDDNGFRVFLQDRDNGAGWSLFGAPSIAPGERRVTFHPHMVERHVREHGISVRERITVSPDADVELRYLEITNDDDTRRRLSITGFAEVMLDDPAAAVRHPAFSQMFVEAEYVASHHALIFHRRPRAADEAPAFLLHQLVLPDAGARAAGHDAARDRFVGRGASAASPGALRGREPVLSGTTGATLDPVMALSATLDLAARGTRRVAFVTLVAASRSEALALADAHRSLAGLEWIFEVGGHRAESELAALQIPAHEIANFQRLLGFLVHPHPGLRAPPEVLGQNALPQSGLWKFGLSGDRPILLVSVREPEHAALVYQVLRAQALWRGRGFAFDVAVLNEIASGYTSTMEDRLKRAVGRAGAEGWLHRPGGVFLVHAEHVSDADRTLLASAARVMLDAAQGIGLSDHLLRLPRAPSELPPLVPSSIRAHASSDLQRPSDLLFDNGWGGFAADGREYVIHLEPGAWTPAPWGNVLANPSFGTVVSEAGSGYTWAGNSGENRLTPWSNDPISDPPGEALYLRDEETGAVWSPTPLPARGEGAYQIRHGAGSTEFRHHGHGIEQSLRVFVPVEAPVKIAALRLVNCSDQPRRLTVTYYAEWVLGTTRQASQQFVLSAFDPDEEVVTARNPWRGSPGSVGVPGTSGSVPTPVAFAAASRKLHGFTTDRVEFFGRHGRRSSPAALRRIGLANTVRAGADPCVALQVHVDLAVGATEEVHFLIGQAADHGAVLDVVRRHRSAESIAAARAEVERAWDRRLGAMEVRTPSAALDLMLNRWLPYQALSARIWGRTGFSQSSGAFGFRDQLQDVAALVPRMPELCRAHLLECARRQFVEGDVLHWWHPPGGAGVRTRCSDDRLWLPFIVAHYVHATGDLAVLDEQVPFLEASPLRREEGDRYGLFPESRSSDTLYAHCLRAIDHGQETGAHGLPLIGTGDWNDGFSRVGVAGRGESVWLGWFLCATLTRFSTVCRRVGDLDRAAAMRERVRALREAIEAQAWDGAWYRRGNYDDGAPLGSAERDECRIDSLAQSWAVLSHAGREDRLRPAMEAVREHLVTDEGLVLLFTPPFDRSTQEPGYVKGYPPGVRENGGQYTHAAVWVAWAFAELGEGGLACRLLERLLPTAHSSTAASARRYRVEPFVIAADIASRAPHAGRGGWTWYTGAAAWAHRLGSEGILGLRPENGGWRLDPCIPAEWPGFEVDLRSGEAGGYRIVVRNPDGVQRGVASVTLDGQLLLEPLLPRSTDGVTHDVVVVLGAPAAH